MADYSNEISLYHNIFMICGVVALAFLILAVTLFFVLKIPQVFGELTGRKARKAIEEMQAESGATGKLTSSRRISEDGRRHRGKKKSGITARTGSAAAQEQAGAQPQETVAKAQELSGAFPQEVTPQQPLTSQQPFPSRQASAQIYGQEGTGVLQTGTPDSGYAQTGVLPDGSAETGILGGNAHPGGSGAGSTAVNSRQQGLAADYAAAGSVSETTVLNGDTPDFIILRSLVEVHADEVVTDG